MVQADEQAKAAAAEEKRKAKKREAKKRQKEKAKQQATAHHPYPHAVQYSQWVLYRLSTQSAHAPDLFV